MNKLEAEILRLEPTLKAHKMACQMSVPGACEAADAVHEDIGARRRELEGVRAPRAPHASADWLVACRAATGVTSAP